MCVTEDRSPITVAWLHEIRPEGWEADDCGIYQANWSIEAVHWDKPEEGPFVWFVAPSHGADMLALPEPCETEFAILVLEDREDVLMLLRLLGRKGGSRDV